jgi:hypothetical protein
MLRATTTVRFTFADLQKYWLNPAYDATGGRLAKTVWAGRVTNDADMSQVIKATAKGMDGIIIVSVDDVKFYLPGGAAIG